jgi:hypothetical protein
MNFNHEARMSGEKRPSADSTTTAAAEYIAVSASQLARTASANDFPLLAYLLDMAVLEAWREASEPDVLRLSSGPDDQRSETL